MAEQVSYWTDPDAWPPRATTCPHCDHDMTPAPKPVRLHDRVCEFLCPKCGGRHSRVAGDPRALFCPGHGDADCFRPLTVGVGPLSDGPDDDGFEFLAPPLGG